jgi:Ser/Thr protein kinase RdoA (MazF antagonist)
MIVSRQLEILSEVAVKALTHYALPPISNVTLINLSENATYKVETIDGKNWALRIHREGYQSKAAIASELSWLMALRDSAVVTTPKPVKGIDGELIPIK